MAKKQPKEAEDAVPKTTTKIRSTTIQKAKALAAIHGQDLYDYLDAVLTPLVEKEYTRRVKE